MMSYYEYFLIFLALGFCAYASYTDLKTQKIRNFCSLGLLYTGTLSQLMGWYLGTTTPLYILALFFGTKASPTILVDTHPFRANQLLRASGTPCQ